MTCDATTQYDCDVSRTVHCNCQSQCPVHRCHGQQTPDPQRHTTLNVVAANVQDPVASTVRQTPGQLPQQHMSSPMKQRRLHQSRSQSGSPMLQERQSTGTRFSAKNSPLLERQSTGTRFSARNSPLLERQSTGTRFSARNSPASSHKRIQSNARSSSVDVCDGAALNGESAQKGSSELLTRLTSI